MSSYPPPPPHANAPLSALPSHPDRTAPTVVQVVAKRGGASQAIFFLLTLALFAMVFVAGLVFGVMAILGAPSSSTMVMEEVERQGGVDRVAIIGVEGPIDEAAARDIKSAVDHVLSDASFRAVVLRVDSPGGGVSPSDRIWREVERLKQASIPVVASYGGIAASGGVYVSCGSDEIVAEPTTTTGSVGVIASVLTYGELFQKVGIEPVTMVATDSPRKDDANDPYRQWTEADRAVLQPLLDHSHTLYRTRVMAGRQGKASDETVLRGVLDGRVLTADQAVAVGLVDSIGYLEDAIAAAERRAGIGSGSATAVRLATPKPLWGGGLLGEFQSLVLRATAGNAGGARAGATAPAPSDGERLRSLLDDLATPRIEYRFR